MEIVYQVTLVPEAVTIAAGTCVYVEQTVALDPGWGVCQLAGHVSPTRKKKKVVEIVVRQERESVTSLAVGEIGASAKLHQRWSVGFSMLTPVTVRHAGRKYVPVLQVAPGTIGDHAQIRVSVIRAHQPRKMHSHVGVARFN